jgi:hypothetical protein
MSSAINQRADIPAPFPFSSVRFFGDLDRLRRARTLAGISPEYITDCRDFLKRTAPALRASIDAVLELARRAAASGGAASDYFAVADLLEKQLFEIPGLLGTCDLIIKQMWCREQRATAPKEGGGE